jgi:hypothetical protein
LSLIVALGLFGLNLTGRSAVANSAASQMPVTPYFADFKGESGNVPTGWNDIGFDTSPESTVVENDKVVAITDIRKPMTDGGGPRLIQSDFSFVAPSNPAARVTLKADIASTTTNTPDGGAQVVVALGNVNGYAVVALFNNKTNQFHINLAQLGNPIATLLPATIFDPGHKGDKFEIKLVFEANGLRLTSGAFDSGDVPYTDANVPGFDSLDDLGGNVGIILGAGAEGASSVDIISTVNFDSVLLDVKVAGRRRSN